MTKFASLLCAALLAATTPALAGVFSSDDTASSVEKDQARTFNKVLKGTIVQVSDAKIEASDTTRGTGTLAGAATGAAVGVGANGNGGVVGGVVGAVVGGLGGAVVSAFAGSQTAQDLIIQLESGELTNITQAVDDTVGVYAEGDAVLVVYKGGSARVIRNKMKVVAPTAAGTN